MTIDEIRDEFRHLEDWEERCDYLIDIGFEVPEFPDEDKTEENRVHGCQSNVWLTVEPFKSDNARLKVQADSDAMIVKGLIAVLLALYDEKTPEEILRTDVKSVFSELGLTRHLSATRRNGLFGMVQRVCDEAARRA